MVVSGCSVAQGTLQNPIKIIVSKRHTLCTNHTYIWHNRSLSWYDTDTSMKSAEVKLVLCLW